jgi:ElaB/YqjD/DUF883 family membrane-anchored ribosome-binding protein
MAGTSSEGGFKQDATRFGQGVEALKHDVGNLADTAADAARSGANELRQGAKQAAGAVKEKIDSAKDTAAEAAESIKGLIERNPLATVAVVGGVGVLLGMLMCRSSN